MNTAILIGLLFQHRVALRGYAMRVILHEQVLPLQEEDDRACRIAEFRAICSSLKLTEKEMVALLPKGFLCEKRQFGSPALSGTQCEE